MKNTPRLFRFILLFLLLVGICASLVWNAKFQDRLPGDNVKINEIASEKDSGQPSTTGSQDSFLLVDALKLQSVEDQTAEFLQVKVLAISQDKKSYTLQSDDTVIEGITASETSYYSMQEQSDDAGNLISRNYLPISIEEFQAKAFKDTLLVIKYHPDTAGRVEGTVLLEQLMLVN